MIARVAEHDYLIIGGATRSATTSLFFYLADHPQVCAATSKETRFFLDRDYPLPSRLRYDEGVERYVTFYPHCTSGHQRMEATPDYLYSPGTPARIRDTLPRAHLLFILREPLSRLVSWYRFAQQTDRLALRVSFSDYVGLQRAGEPDTPQHLRALEQGRYSEFLAPWLDTLGAARISVLFNEELGRAPRDVLRQVCRQTGLDPGFYDSYEFKRHNPARVMRNAGLNRLYMRVRYEARNRVLGRQRARAALTRLRRAVEPLYRRINVRHSEVAVTIEPRLRTELRQYYANERQALEQLIGRAPPWPTD